MGPPVLGILTAPGSKRLYSPNLDL